MSTAELAVVDNGLETLFWCGLVMVLLALVHETSRLTTRPAMRRLFVSSRGFGSGGWCLLLYAGLLLPVVLMSEMLCHQPPWVLAGRVVQAVALLLLGLCLFTALRRLPRRYGWCRPLPALLLSLMLARCCWLLMVIF